MIDPTITRRTVLTALVAAGSTALAKPTTASQQSIDGWPYANHDPANTSHAPNATGPRESIEMESIVSVDGTLERGCCVADETVYFGTEETVEAYSTEGTEQWSLTVLDPPAGQPVAYADQLLFVNTGGNESVIRFVETDGPEQRVRASAGPNATITPVDDSVYVAGNEGVVSLDRSGTGQWQRPLEQPTVGMAVGEQELFVTTESEVIAVQRADGEVKWRETVQARHAPVVADGRIYVGGETLVALDSTDGTELWRSTDLPAVTTIPAATTEAVYVGAGDGDGEDTFFAVDAGSGKINWRAPLGGTAVPTTNPATTRPAVTAEMVYVGSEQTMHGLDAETGEIAWRATVDGTVGSPVPVDDQLLFTTTEGEVIVVDKSQSDSGTGDQSEDSNNDGNQDGANDDNDGETEDTQRDGADSDDGSGPGFGVSTGLAALGGVGYLLRRLRSGRDGSSREFSEEMDQREQQDDTDE